jgi:hypothetical protein
MLCPAHALFFNGAVLIACRAVPLTELEFKKAWEEESLPAWDYPPPNDEGAPFECKGADWGWFQDRLVVIDYANTESLIEML